MTGCETARRPTKSLGIATSRLRDHIRAEGLTPMSLNGLPHRKRVTHERFAILCRQARSRSGGLGMTIDEIAQVVRYYGPPKGHGWTRHVLQLLTEKERSRR